MADQARGVVVVGALPNDAIDPERTRAQSGNVVLGAIGAWLVDVRVAVCSVIKDERSEELMRRLSRNGMDVSRIRAASGAAAAPSSSDPTPDQLDSVGMGWTVHLCRMSAGRQREIIRSVWHRVALVTVDSLFAGDDVREDRAQLFDLAADCDAIVLRRQEVEPLWPGKAPRDILRLLARHGARTAVITLAGGAAIGIRDRRVVWMPAFPFENGKQTPGRDAYAAAFSAAFTIDRDLRRAMAWAGAAASAVVETASPLELLNDVARQTVAARARLLHDESQNGWRLNSGS